MQLLFINRKLQFYLIEGKYIEAERLLALFCFWFRVANKIQLCKQIGEDVSPLEIFCRWKYMNYNETLKHLLRMQWTAVVLEN